MTFEIDTGTTIQAPHEHWFWDGILDKLPSNATDEEKYIAIGNEIKRTMWKHKKPETVRQDLIKNWPVIAHMATVAPDAFDSVLSEFAERATEFR